MAEWRLLRGFSRAEIETRLARLSTSILNFEADEPDLTGESGWSHFCSEAVIARHADAASFERARVALINYCFSNPAIVRAHFTPDSALPGRRMLLEIRVLGLRYLGPALVSRIRDEDGLYGFRYDTLEGHIERGAEWFLLTITAEGEIRFRIEARWQRGDLPNWWSDVGFAVLAAHYRRVWHRDAHRRMALFAHYGSLTPPPGDVSGLTQRAVDVLFNTDAQRKWPT